MKSRLVTELDYPMLYRWWLEHKFPPPPLEALPKVGVIVEDCAAGFIYQTDSCIAWLEWIVVDPTCDKIKRRQALDGLVKELSQLAKEKGYKTLFSSSVHPGLIERLKQAGFMVGDNNTTQLIRNI